MDLSIVDYVLDENYTTRGVGWPSANIKNITYQRTVQFLKNY